MTGIIDRLSNVPGVSQAINAGATVSDAVRSPINTYIEPFQRTQVQRDAAKTLGVVLLGSLGAGATASILQNMRRANERKFLNEQLARSVLEVSIDDEDKKKSERKEGAFSPSVILPKITGQGKKILSVLKKHPIASSLGAGLLGYGAIARGSDRQPEPSVTNRVLNTLINSTSGVANTSTEVLYPLVPASIKKYVTPVAKSVASELDKIQDLSGTIRGENAKNIGSVPWLIPLASGAALAGMLGSYHGLNSIVDARAEKKLKKKKEEAKKRLEEALSMEQAGKTAEVLDAFVTEAGKLAANVKEASMVEWYLSLLGVTGVLSALGAANSGYKSSSKKQQMDALKMSRHLQLARRRNEDLNLISSPRQISDIAAETSLPDIDDDDTDDTIKSAAMPRGILDKILLGSLKGLGLGAVLTGKGAKTLVKSPVMAPVRGLVAAPFRNPITTLTGLVGAEALGRGADYFRSPWGQWKPSEWVMRRFQDRSPMVDYDGNPIYGTVRDVSPTGLKRTWSWNPFSGIKVRNSEGKMDVNMSGWQGIGWRFRPQNAEQPDIVIPKRPVTASPPSRSVASRRRMNAQFYD